MLLLGIALIIVAALIQFATWSITGALFVVGIACVVLGLILGEGLPKRQ